MSYQTFIVISPKGAFPHFIMAETDTIEHFLGAFSISKVKNHPVAFSIEGEPGEYNRVASKWTGKPFHGTLIVLDTNGKPFPGFDEAFKVIDEIRSTYFSEVPNAGN